MGHDGKHRSVFTRKERIAVGKEEVTEILVEFGDTVQEGVLLATVDFASDRTAMSELQDEIGKLDDKITDVTPALFAAFPGKNATYRYNPCAAQIHMIG